MSELIELGNQKLSVIKDPFFKTKVNRINVCFQDFWNDGNWKATGVVEFKNGETSGVQNFKGETFDDVVIQIKAVLDNLKK